MAPELTKLIKLNARESLLFSDLSFGNLESSLVKTYLEPIDIFPSQFMQSLFLIHHSSCKLYSIVGNPYLDSSYLFFPLTCPHSPFSTESLGDIVKIKYDYMVHLLKTQQWLFIKTRIKAKLLALAFKDLLTFFSDFSFSFLSLSLCSRYIGLPSVPKTCQVHFWLEVFA